jgi:hypothetical protein
VPIDTGMSARSERAPRRSALYQGVGFRRAARLALGALLGALVIAAVVRGGFGVATAGGLAGVVLCVAALWEARVRRIGIRIEPQGILAVYPVGHLRLPLEAVAGFSLRDRGPHHATRHVVIELLNGEHRPVPSAGRTADVAAALDAQLQRARRQAAAALSDGLSAAL